MDRTRFQEKIEYAHIDVSIHILLVANFRLDPFPFISFSYLIDYSKVLTLILAGLWKTTLQTNFTMTFTLRLGITVKIMGNFEE